MEKEAYWELFYKTGDPLAWLMHRSRQQSAAPAAEEPPQVQIGPAKSEPGD